MTIGTTRDTFYPSMPDCTTLFVCQAVASAHIQCVHDLAAGQVVFVNDAHPRGGAVVSMKLTSSPVPTRRPATRK